MRNGTAELPPFDRRQSMVRIFPSLVSLMVLVLGLPILLAGCSGEISEPVETTSDAGIETVALTVEGMT